MIKTPFGTRVNIPQVPTLKEHAVNLVAAISELDCFIRCKPVGTFCPEANSLSSEAGVANDIPFVCITIQISCIPVKEPAKGRLEKARQVGVSAFHAHIQVGDEGYTAEIKPGGVGCVTRIADGRNLVFNKGVAVKGKPVAQARDAIRVIYGGAPVTGIIATTLRVMAGRKIQLNGMKRDGKIRPTEQSGTTDAEFKVRRGLEIQLDAVDHRLLGQGPAEANGNVAILRIHKMLTRKFAYPVFRAQGAKILEDAGQHGRLGLINAEHIHGLSVVAPQERITRGGSPKGLLAERCLPAFDVETDVGIQKPWLIESRNGRGGSYGRLEVSDVDVVLLGLRESGSRRRMFVFAANDKAEHAGGATGRESGEAAGSLLIWTAIVIHNGLAKVITIGEWRAGDAGDAGVHRIDADVGINFTIEFAFEFTLQC